MLTQDRSSRNAVTQFKSYVGQPAVVTAERSVAQCRDVFGQCFAFLQDNCAAVLEDESGNGRSRFFTEAIVGYIIARVEYHVADQINGRRVSSAGTGGLPTLEIPVGLDFTYRVDTGMKPLKPVAAAAVCRRRCDVLRRRPQGLQHDCGDTRSGKKSWHRHGRCAH